MAHTDENEITVEPLTTEPWRVRNPQTGDIVEISSLSGNLVKALSGAGFTEVDMGGAWITIVPTETIICSGGATEVDADCARCHLHPCK